MEPSLLSALTCMEIRPNHILHYSGYSAAHWPQKPEWLAVLHPIVPSFHIQLPEDAGCNKHSKPNALIMRANSCDDLVLYCSGSDPSWGPQVKGFYRYWSYSCVFMGEGDGSGYFASMLELECLNNNWHCSRGYIISSSSWVPGPQARIPEDQLYACTCVLMVCVCMCVCAVIPRSFPAFFLIFYWILLLANKRWMEKCLPRFMSPVPISVHAREGVCVYFMALYSQELLTPRSLPH